MDILSINKFYYHKGGSETVFFGEKKLLEEKGHRVVPFSMKHPQNLKSKYAKYFVENIDYEQGGFLGKLLSALNIVYSFEAKRKIARLLGEIHPIPNLAHFHIFQHQISPSVFGPLRDKKIPIILTLHDLKPMCPNYKMYTHGQVCERCIGGKFYNCLKYRCTKGSSAKSLVNVIEMYLHDILGYYKNVDRYIAVSQFYRNKMVEFGFSPSQVIYIPNFIDISQFEVSAKDKGYVLYFGRLSEEKGLDTLVTAAKSCPDIPIKIAGTGPYERYLKDLTEKLAVSNIEFMGFRTGGELTQLIQESSFTVIPSEWYENCPMSVLESMAMGKPVLGANIGGIPELIETEVDGLVFAPRDVDDLAEKIEQLWRRNDRSEMGLLGRKKIERDFAPDTHYEKLIETYREVA